MTTRNLILTSRRSQEVDICFYNCIIELENDKQCLNQFYTVRMFVAFLFILFPTNNKDPNHDEPKITFECLSLILMIYDCASQIFTQVIESRLLRKRWWLYNLALKINHSSLITQSNIQQQPNPSVQRQIPKQFRCSSTVYQFKYNILIIQTDSNYRQKAEQKCKMQIREQLSNNYINKLCGWFLNFCSISIVLILIGFLVLGKRYNGLQFVFLICYIVMQLFSRQTTFDIFILPWWKFGLCIYWCLCNQVKIKLPKVIQAKAQTIRECQGNCPICIQDLVVSQKVIILKCSPKHVFHQVCIKAWTQPDNDTCPICRAQI